MTARAHSRLHAAELPAAVAGVGLHVDTTAYFSSLTLFLSALPFLFCSLCTLLCNMTIPTTPSSIISEILPHLQCTWLAVTLICTSFSKRQFKLQATCAFRFMCCVNISWIMHAIFHAEWESERFQTSKVTFKVMVPFDRPQTISCLPLQLCPYLALLPRYYHLFLKFKDVKWPWTQPLQG